MKKEANQLYRRPQMMGQARDEEEEPILTQLLSFGLPFFYLAFIYCTVYSPF